MVRTCCRKSLKHVKTLFQTFLSNLFCPRHQQRTSNSSFFPTEIGCSTFLPSRYQNPDVFSRFGGDYRDPSVLDHDGTPLVAITAMDALDLRGRDSHPGGLRFLRVKNLQDAILRENVRWKNCFNLFLCLKTWMNDVVLGVFVRRFDDSHRFWSLCWGRLIRQMEAWEEKGTPKRHLLE